MYDAKFYSRYEREYVLCPSVREKHNWLFELVKKHIHPDDWVLDLGCGESQEFRRFGPKCTYTGMDKDVRGSQLEMDYRLFDWKTLSREIGVFVSLFSTEITAPSFANYTMYNRIFEETAIGFGLVSGFYYLDKCHLQIIEETRGILSYQTLDSLVVGNKMFEERRIEMAVPSDMFGPNVIEVWKFFFRR